LDLVSSAVRGKKVKVIILDDESKGKNDFFNFRALLNTYKEFTRI